MPWSWSSWWFFFLDDDMNSDNDVTTTTTNLWWIVPTLLCLVAGSAVYASHQKLQALDQHERQAKEERLKTREQRGAHPLSSPQQNPKEENTDTNNTNVWAERRRRGIVASTTNSIHNHNHNKKSSNSDDKPFSSSYYYAHNQSKAKGGYTDGLSLEDFTMNGPRLLSRGGQPVVVPPNSTEPQPPQPQQGVREQEPRAQEEESAETTTSTQQQQQQQVYEIRTIGRYQWDDPGDSSGIANLRIDTLPMGSSSSSSSSTTRAWKDARIESVEATLIPNNHQTDTLSSPGLRVVARSTVDAVEYRLELPRLYGPVSQVACKTTKKRLVVQLHKTLPTRTSWWWKPWENSSTVPNTAAWPHPYATK